MQPDPPTREPARTIFIRGVAPRSGTNYLRDLVLLLPGVGRGRSPVWEDFILDDARLLRAYAGAVVARWPDAWGVDRAAVRAELLAAMGAAARDVLVGADSPTVVAKTPYTRGIDLFPTLYPTDVLVLLVRDGRSVVESLRRSFDWSFERAVQEWSASAARIRDFMAAHSSAEGRTWALVRYEDCLSDPVGVLDRIAELAGLPTGQVDDAAARSLPVRGSSDLSGATGGLHWQPVERDASFSPEKRWDGWTPRMHRRFNWVAGDSMLALGYSLSGKPPTQTAAVLHHGLDILSRTGAAARVVRTRAGSYRRSGRSTTG